MPAIVLQIIALIQIASNPENIATVKRAWESARQLFSMLFAGGLITVAQQEALMKFAEEHEAAVLRGEVPPEFTVEADPV